MEKVYFAMAIVFMVLFFTYLIICTYEGMNDYQLEINRLKKIIKKQNKEIKKLKNLGGYIYDNYMKKEND